MEQKEVNHEWKNIKNTILESAEEIIKTREKHIRNEWWDEERKEAISKKNIARKKCLQKRTRAKQEQYTQAKKEANNICKEKKKQWLNNRLKQIEEAHKQNETKFLRTYEHSKMIALLPYLLVKMKVVH